MNNDTTLTKTCTVCEQTFPATTEYFHKGKYKYGVRNICKTCRNESRLKPPKPQAPDGYKTCTKCGETFPATIEYFHREKHGKYGLMARCKQCMYEQKQQWKKDNPDKVKAQARRDYYKNQEKRNQETRDYYKRNSERIIKLVRKKQVENRETFLRKKREYNSSAKGQEKRKEYQQAHRMENRIKTSQRRARKRALPDTFTPKQWVACLEYFNYCCAVCGNQLRDLFGEVSPHADHWIPINYKGEDNPGTVAENMVCLCNSCNPSKSDKMPEVWLKETYGTRRANEILARIQAYFLSLS